VSHESYRRWPYTAEPVVYSPMISCDILGCLNGTVVGFPPFPKFPQFSPDYSSNGANNIG
jgi:hypothetical protein